MKRILALATAALMLAALPPAPVRAADDDFARKLIDACVGCTLPKDLHGRDLHGLHFVGTNLRDADLTHANLAGAEFTGANLDGTRFDDADLRDARFVGVRLHNTSFARANTAGVKFVGIRLDAAGATGPMGLTIIRDCTGCRLEGLDLHDADLRGIKVVGARLSDVKLAGAKLNGANLVGADARDADLARADLSGANLIATKLSGAHLAGATIGDAVLCADNRGPGASPRIACTDLRDVDLHGVDLRSARHCTDDVDDGARTCRTVTRAELVEFAHADLTGALAPN